ncbi:hypothetical protein B0H13DRAFT_2448094 [Mycena leptocephala]|nr:hypothetical protein B0H13DRAFT_2448094 [Mycena leptocephala]
MSAKTLAAAQELLAGRGLLGMLRSLIGIKGAPALTVHRHPGNIHSKFVLLTLRRRSEKETSVLNAFAYEQVHVFGRHDLDSVVEGDPAELQDHIGENDQQAKRHRLAGAALLVVKIKQTSEITEAENHHIVRAVPIILIEEHTHTEEKEWEEMIKDVIKKEVETTHRKDKHTIPPSERGMAGTAMREVAARSRASAHGADEHGGVRFLRVRAAVGRLCSRWRRREGQGCPADGRHVVLLGSLGAGNVLVSSPAPASPKSQEGVFSYPWSLNIEYARREMRRSGTPAGKGVTMTAHKADLYKTGKFCVGMACRRADEYQDRKDGTTGEWDMWNEAGLRA